MFNKRRAEKKIPSLNHFRLNQPSFLSSSSNRTNGGVTGLLMSRATCSPPTSPAGISSSNCPSQLLYLTWVIFSHLLFNKILFLEALIFSISRHQGLSHPRWASNICLSLNFEFLSLAFSNFFSFCFVFDQEDQGDWNLATEKGWKKHDDCLLKSPLWAVLFFFFCSIKNQTTKSFLGWILLKTDRKHMHMYQICTTGRVYLSKIKTLAYSYKFLQIN